MKKVCLFFATVMLLASGAVAQRDTTQSDKIAHPDTIRIGSMVIVKKSPNRPRMNFNSKEISIEWGHFRRSKHNRNVKNCYMVVDIGFSNFSDKTNYASPEAGNYAKATRPGEAPFSASDFNLRNMKSINFNLWFFMQERNLYKNVLGFRYGIGIETNNYRFANNISFKEGNLPYVFRDSISFRKNKLALDYLTVPLMLTVNTSPRRNNAFSFGMGASVGYLYSSRNKQISAQSGKQRNRGAYDVENWKLSLIGELGFGSLRVYGSYAPRSMFERGLNMKPYTIGLRVGM